MRLEEINVVKFPGGELSIDLSTHHNRAISVINARLNSSDDIMCLLLYVNHLKTENIPVPHVIIPYFPYARQDKQDAPGRIFTLKTMVSLIDNLGCKSITVIDPHSDVLPGMFRNTPIYIEEAKKFVSDISSDLKDIILVFPDLGAAKRYGKQFINLNPEYVSFIKKRDPKTGHLSDFRIVENEIKNIENKRFLIIDDICDGGRTFINVKNELIKLYPGIPVDLYVTHGIFSGPGGVEALLKNHFSKIYTTNSFQDFSGNIENLVVYDVR